MRLNLGEIAHCLGCGPGNVIWDGPYTMGGKGRGTAKAPASIRELVLERSGQGRPAPENHLTSLWENAPWAQVTPAGASIDSRKVLPGDLFFCLPGERVDGHDFAAEAIAAGAAAVIAGRNPFAPGRGSGPDMLHVPVFLVDDVTRALWRLAMCHRDTSPARIIGLTGTAGKTSVKEVLAQVLEVRGRTDRNILNMNNQIGLPVSMLRASADASFWVMEMGISQGPDMDELGGILRPDIGIILNVGQGHVAGLGEHGVAACKARLLDYIQPGGLAFVSEDYPELSEQVEKRRLPLSQRGIQVLRFSTTNPDAYSYARYIGPSGGGGGLYEIRGADDTRLEVSTPFRSEYGSENVAAIMGVVRKLGLSRAEIKAALTMAKLPDQRFRVLRYTNFTLLDDSYNANPLSARRMLQAAGDMAAEYGQPLILVMGEMLELGDVAEAAHEDLGRDMARNCPKAVFWKGGQEHAVRRGLREAGYQGPFHPVAGPDFPRLLDDLRPDRALILFKGSRSNRIEDLLETFTKKLGEWEHAL